MSVARGYGLNGRGYYTNVCKPEVCHLNFIVDAANGNGLGIRSLKSNGFVESVFMHTSATPGVVSGWTNPNPASGFAVVRFKNNFNYYLGGFSGFVSPTINATTAVTSGLTVGQAYVITVLGTTTLAEWQTIGLPQGLTPTVGQTFIAIATGTGGAHTGKVGTPSVSGISGLEVVGDPNQTIANSNIAANAGAIVVVQFLAPTGSGTIAAPALTMNSYTPAGTNAAVTVPVTSGTAGNAVTLNAGTTLECTGGGTVTASTPAFTGTPATLTGTVAAPVFTSTSVFAPTAPASNSVVGMTFYFDGSSVTIDGI